MEQEQNKPEQGPAKLGSLGAKLAKAKVEEKRIQRQQPASAPPETSEAPVSGGLEAVSPIARGKPTQPAAPPCAPVTSPKQATVKMNERMQLAWALMRATSGRTLQELQHAAFDEFLKKHWAYDLVDLHTQTTARRGTARRTL